MIEEKVVDPSSPILWEAIVQLGNPSTYQMKHPVRLIGTQDSKGNLIMIMTNDMAISAEEVSDVYRYRWHIELF
ncbi:IS4 family transposase, partial [Frankia sp. Mgl5]|nr:IS4 family transposase [Frankia sp. Mgl5]